MTRTTALAIAVARAQRPLRRLPNGIRAHVVTPIPTSELITRHFVERHVEPLDGSPLDDLIRARAAAENKRRNAT